MMSDSDRIPVLVTTAHRGVFFGFAAESEMQSKEKLTLTRVRNCIYWNAAVGGFLGLAADGPGPDCNIGREAPQALLHDITSVTLCTPEAAEKWTAA